MPSCEVERDLPSTGSGIGIAESAPQELAPAKLRVQLDLHLYLGAITLAGRRQSHETGYTRP